MITRHLERLDSYDRIVRDCEESVLRVAESHAELPEWAKNSIRRIVRDRFHKSKSLLTLGLVVGKFPTSS